MGYELVDVSTPEDWAAYHDIRRRELFEARGRFGIYNPNYPDEHTPDKHHYLLKHDGKPVGTTRLDVRGDGSAVFRLVAITATEQGKGHGRVLSELVEGRARGFGAHTLLVNAARTALGYYEKTGWQVHEWDASELVDMAAECVQMRKLL
ncbi:GNAT family N-acetyltransferase [Devosia sp. SL43]|uniref:GNAT family N-acetyltransferase n=1 Tax=Devosia sp. SL43 TaxID=2806348 RepID=UPI001F24C043|nr:GNAT family N-acetyltransferase [Devosia sp. SL43]UJW86686.1 GNAT family N-acetyltransferase [Devosia sp. SL43]